MMTRAVLVGVAAITAIAASLTPPLAAPRLLWNTTASAPLGLWTLQTLRRPAVGDWLAVRPPLVLARALDGRGVLPMGVLLLKQVAAVAPSRVCRSGDRVLIDGRLRASAQAADRWGRALPQWRACRVLRPGELFLLNPAQGSFDSRYFGPLTAADVVADARPWITRTGGRHD